MGASAPIAHTPQCPSHSFPNPSACPPAPKTASSRATASAKGMRSMCRYGVLSKASPSRRFASISTASANSPGHTVYPYLLRGLEVSRPNQVWAMDITYIPMPRGFVYLAAVMDWHSRKVLVWRVSVTMDTDFCVEALEESLGRHGAPEKFNTDQGSQFTSDAFTDLLKANGIQISMDGKGSWKDNVFVERLWKSVKY